MSTRDLRVEDADESSNREGRETPCHSEIFSAGSEWRALNRSTFGVLRECVFLNHLFFRQRTRDIAS